MYIWKPEPVFWNVYGAPELIPINEFRQPYGYDNPIPPRFLAPIDFLKSPTQFKIIFDPQQ